MIPILKELVQKGNQVKFTKYFDGNLWYEVCYWKDSDASRHFFEFPVPISDIGNATFLAVDNALLFMRYIRKHIEMLTKAMGE